MRISLLLVLFTFMSCGKEVNLNTKKLEGLALTSPNQTGTLARSPSGDTLMANGRSYTISQYSSRNADMFIRSRPVPSNTSVLFKGDLRGNEAVLETLQAP